VTKGLGSSYAVGRAARVLLLPMAVLLCANQGKSPQAAAALNAWAAQVPSISPVAYAYQGYPLNRAMFNATVQRVTQAIVGELEVDEALERLTADVEEAVAESAQ